MVIRSIMNGKLYYDQLDLVRLEITISGAYDPQWINSRELRQKYDNARKSKQSDSKEEL